MILPKESATFFKLPIQLFKGVSYPELALMEKYADHPKVVADDVVIPVFSNQRTNSYLKEIASLAKIKKHLTSHIARHTFATMSLANHVPIESISKMLGHVDIKTTQIYAKMQDHTIYEDMEKMRKKFNSKG